MGNEITLTDEMKLAVEMITSNNVPLYITGKAGTGKTTLLKYITENIDREFVICAPTGVAAINAGGVTLNSMFQIPLGIVTAFDEAKSGMSNAKKEILELLDILIIDEVSMVNPCIMDFINLRLQRAKKNSFPFGGVKVIMFGDLYQLPPVITAPEQKAISSMYDDIYFFNSHVIRNSGLNVVELNHVFRQSDEEFISVLNNIRNYKATKQDFNVLYETRDLDKNSRMDTNAVHLCALKRDAQKINSDMLGDKFQTFKAIVTGSFNPKSSPADSELNLRIGARIMLLNNDPDGKYFNGSLGVVSEILNNGIVVTLDSNRKINVGKYTWKSYEYVIAADKSITKKESGTFTQYPVALAWAMTIHKSQGLTFDNVALHLKFTFASGQLYVALSRCRTLEGITTDCFIGPRHIIANDSLVEFETNYKKNGMKYLPSNN